MNFAELQRAQARWVRLFLTLPQLDRGLAADHGAVNTILDADRRGDRTILTLKLPYNRVAFPDADSPHSRSSSLRLDAVLPLVMGKVHILVIGNEPFIESRRQDWNPNFDRFYEKLATGAVVYRRQRSGAGCKTHLYMGALNHIERPAWPNATTARWMAFVTANPGID